MNKRVLILLLMLLSALAVSCAGQTDDDVPGINLSIGEMNKAFQIIDPPEFENSHKNDDVLTLQLKNLSDMPIIFPGGFGIKILKQEEQGWIPVKNNFRYPAEENTLPVHKLFPPGLGLSLGPYIPNLQKAETIRIILIGHKADSPNELVGAYIDILLLP